MVRSFSHGWHAYAGMKFNLFLIFARARNYSCRARHHALVEEKTGGTYKLQDIPVSKPVEVHVAYLRSWADNGMYGLRMVMPPDVYGFKVQGSNRLKIKPFLNKPSFLVAKPMN